MSHPLANAFLLIFWFFLWIMWFMLLFRVIADLFTDKSLSGWAKTGWLLLVLLVPFIGILIYLIVRGHSMAERADAQAEQGKQEFDEYVRKTAGTSAGGNQVEQLSKLSDLRSSGAITDAEFQQAKQKILA